MPNTSLCSRPCSRTAVDTRYAWCVFPHRCPNSSCPSLADEYWAAHPELHDIPIYYASSLAKKCMAGYLKVWPHLSCYFINGHCLLVAVYQTFIGAMNERIQRQIAISNPFVFKHIQNLKVCSCDTCYIVCTTSPVCRVWTTLMT